MPSYLLFGQVRFLSIAMFFLQTKEKGNSFAKMLYGFFHYILFLKESWGEISIKERISSIGKIKIRS